jgi:hypothetical protein
MTTAGASTKVKPPRIHMNRRLTCAGVIGCLIWHIPTVDGARAGASFPRFGRRREKERFGLEPLKVPAGGTFHRHVRPHRPCLDVKRADVAQVVQRDPSYDGAGVAGFLRIEQTPLVRPPGAVTVQRRIGAPTKRAYTLAGRAKSRSGRAPPAARPRARRLR